LTGAKETESKVLDMLEDYAFETAVKLDDRPVVGLMFLRTDLFNIRIKFE